jgi:5-methylcytosine-specific restriction endonuclease McrA
MANPYIRLIKLDIDTVLPLLVVGDKTERISLSGTKVHVGGLRLSTFKQKGLRCASCGITGSFFALEDFVKRDKTAIAESHHIQLYAVKTVNGEDQEVLMTHDHILARSAGGRDNMENSQPMCSPCNSEKSKTENRNLPPTEEKKKRSWQSANSKRVVPKLKQKRKNLNTS